LAGTDKALFFQDSHNFFCSNLGKFLGHEALDCHLDGRGTNGFDWFRNFLLFGEAVFQMKPNSVPDVFEGFFIGIALAVAALEFGTECKIAVLVMLDQNGKTVMFYVD
jgi:hypothetical protein